MQQISSAAFSDTKPHYELTAKIVSAASFLDIRVLDHLIICESGYYSFADEGRL